MREMQALPTFELLDIVAQMIQGLAAQSAAGLITQFTVQPGGQLLCCAGE